MPALYFQSGINNSSFVINTINVQQEFIISNFHEFASVCIFAARVVE